MRTGVGLAGRKVGGTAAGTFVLLLTIGTATGCGEATVTGKTSPSTIATTSSPVASMASIAGKNHPTATRTSPNPKLTATPTVTSTQTVAAPPAVAPSTKGAAPPIPAKTTPAAPAPSASSAPAPAPSVSATHCYPLSNAGHCYEPGEYCRTSDHGMHGVAGDGEAIICEDNNGWRWEPA